ncbi:MAG: hypothetical protein ACRDTA_13225 [Pseudonocardiaceae bacterium]
MRGTYPLVDTLEVIPEELLTVAFEREIGNQSGLLLALDALAEAATAVQVVGEVERETRADRRAGRTPCGARLVPA